MLSSQRQAWGWLQLLQLAIWTVSLKFTRGASERHCQAPVAVCTPVNDDSDCLCEACIIKVGPVADMFI